MCLYVWVCVYMCVCVSVNEYMFTSLCMCLCEYQRFIVIFELEQYKDVNGKALFNDGFESFKLFFCFCLPHSTCSPRTKKAWLHLSKFGILCFFRIWHEIENSSELEFTYNSYVSKMLLVDFYIISHWLGCHQFFLNGWFS